MCPLMGCKGHVNAEASVSGNGRAKAARANEEPEAAPAEVDPTRSGFNAMETDATGGAALLGARHDLRLADVRRPPPCQCLAVAVGPAEDPAFFWEAGVPEIQPGRQIVVALSSEGIDCPGAAADSLGASYWGYEQRGAEVIVVVEQVQFGRPVTYGAIVPKPTTGKVLIRPRTKGSPYGRPLSGDSNLCAVSVP